MKKIKCPNCDKEMHKVEILSHYGIKIIIDQCQVCGGLWFDDEECLTAGLDQHKKIDLLNEKKLAEILPLREALTCPHDNTTLKILNDKYFSKEIDVEYCPKCLGFWFNRGEFSGYQEERKNKVWKEKNKSEKELEFEQQISKCLGVYSETGKYETIGKIGKLLSSPVNRREGAIFSGGGVTGEGNYSQLAYGVYLIVTSLLKIISAGKK
jgi:Zn-finger nucleic acid-binding protein